MKRKYHISKRREKKMITIHFHYILIRSGYIRAAYQNLKEAIKNWNK
jgi:hypothetical protein